MSDVWRSAHRVVVAAFWLYFASQKWGGVSWMRPLMQAAPAANPIPGLRQLLAVVVGPNWHVFAVTQAAGETAIGILLLLGLGTRKVAVAGSVLALNIALTVAFELSDPGLRWLYYLALLANLDLVFLGGGPVAVERIAALPRWVRAWER